VLSARGLGAPHLRERLWIIASRSNADADGQQGPAPSPIQVVEPRGPRALGAPRAGVHTPPDHPGRAWDVAPVARVRRVDDGVPARLVRRRLAALGNAVVPQMAELVGWRAREILSA
jgi:DNA (cytosine-5)-methyltransferase 1